MTGERLLVLGGGGIGGLIAGRLTDAGHDVTLADQWPEHIEAIRESGLSITEPTGDRVVRVRALHMHELQGEGLLFDAVFLAVKGYDTEWVAALAGRHVTPTGAVLVCQNGITDLRVAAMVGTDRTLGCVVTVAGELIEAGRVRRADTYPVGFRVGELDGPVSDRARHYAALLNDVAVTCTTGNLAGERWAKLATNCMVNALSGLSGYSAGEVRSRDDTLSVLIHLGSETIKVGCALGHHVEAVMGLNPDRFVAASAGVGRNELVDALRAVAKSTGGHRASMLQDVLKGRRTEIEELNGFVERMGLQTGVETPFNSAAAGVVRQQPVGELNAAASNIEPLLVLAKGL